MKKFKRTLTQAPTEPALAAANMAGTKTRKTPKRKPWRKVEREDAARALSQFQTLPDCALVRLPVVTALHSVGPATIWRWVKAGRVPAPVKLGPNTTAWRVGELRRSLAQEA